MERPWHTLLVRVGLLAGASALLATAPNAVVLTHAESVTLRWAFGPSVSLALTLPTGVALSLLALLSCL